MTERTYGGIRSENVGISSEKRSENLLHRNPKGSHVKFVFVGLVWT